MKLSLYSKRINGGFTRNVTEFREKYDSKFTSIFGKIEYQSTFDFTEDRHAYLWHCDSLVDACKTLELCNQEIDGIVFDVYGVYSIGISKWQLGELEEFVEEFNIE